jgi:hypothetical protein
VSRQPFGLIVLSLTIALGLLFRATGIATAEADHGAVLRRAAAIVEQAENGPTTLRGQRAREALDVLTADPALARQSWLTDPLTATPPDLRQAQARLIAVLAALEPGPRPIPGGRGALDDVLADPRFRPVDWTRDLPSWLLPVASAGADAIRVGGAIVRWPIDRLFDALRAVVGSALFPPTLAVLALAVGTAVAWLYRRGLRAALVAQAETAPPPDLPPLTAAAALERANARARALDYRQATHYVLLAALLRIEERDGIRFDRAATNREHLARLAAGPAADERGRARLAAIVDRFDRTWYGHQTVSRDDYAELLRLVEDLVGVRA